MTWLPSRQVPSLRVLSYRFRNTEVLTIPNGKITRAEVYFGWNL